MTYLIMVTFILYCMFLKEQFCSYVSKENSTHGVENFELYK